MKNGRLGAVAVALGALLAGASPASAAELLEKNVTAARAVDRSCTAGKLTSGGGYVQETVTMPGAGSVAARLVAGSGDWDVAVFKADSGQVVAGSAARAAREVAGGFAVAGQRLVIQACRLTGSATSAGLSVQSTPIATTNVPTARLVRVSAPNAQRERQLTSLGLDVTEHGGAGFLEVVLHSAADAAKLTANNFTYTVEVPNLALQARRDRAADRGFAAATAASGLPSGRSTYRRLFDCGGNRAAYYHAQENTADASKHAVLAGRAPAGAVLRLKKRFQTPTFDGSTFTDTLDSTLQVAANGVFEWHANPSTRPLVAKGSGRPPHGHPSAPIQFASRGGTTPCANFDTRRRGATRTI